MHSVIPEAGKNIYILCMKETSRNNSTLWVQIFWWSPNLYNAQDIGDLTLLWEINASRNYREFQKFALIYVALISRHLPFFGPKFSISVNFCHSCHLRKRSILSKRRSGRNSKTVKSDQYHEKSFHFGSCTIRVTGSSSLISLYQFWSMWNLRAQFLSFWMATLSFALSFFIRKSFSWNSR